MRFNSLETDKTCFLPLNILEISTFLSVEADCHNLQIKSFLLFRELKFKCYLSCLATFLQMFLCRKALSHDQNY